MLVEKRRNYVFVSSTEYDGYRLVLNVTLDELAKEFKEWIEEVPTSIADALANGDRIFELGKEMTITETITVTPTEKER